MGSKSPKLARNPNPNKIRGFLSNFGAIWAILVPLESLERLESLKNSILGQKIQKVAQKAQNWH